MAWVVGNLSSMHGSVPSSIPGQLDRPVGVYGTPEKYARFSKRIVYAHELVCGQTWILSDMNLFWTPLPSCSLASIPCYHS